MKLDLKKFKKVSEDKNSAVLRHQDGHEIKIAKHVLSPENQKSLSSLPMHLADGGMASSQESENEKNKYLEDIANTGPQVSYQAEDAKKEDSEPIDTGINRYLTNGMFDYDKYILSQGENAPMSAQTLALKNIADKQEAKINQEAAAIQAKQNEMMEYNKQAARLGLPPIAPQGSGAPSGQIADVSDDVGPAPGVEGSTKSAPQAAAAPPVLSAPSGMIDANLNKPYEAGLVGVQNQLSATKQLGQIEQERMAEEAKLYQANIEKRQAELDRGKQILDGLHQEHQAFMEDYKNQHIDPNHYFTSMGTGQRMATAIGLILGGFGGPGESSMDRFIKQQIDNDMRAQEAEMNKKHNLISANYQQFGNIRQAEEMYQAQTKSILADQIMQQAAKSGSKAAMANAQMAAGKLQWEASQHLQSLAFQQMQLEAMKGQLTGQGGISANPELTVRTVVPESQKPAAYKELADAQDSVRFKDNVMQAFDKLEKINTVGGAIMSPIQTGKQVDAIKKPITASLSKGTAGRFTEADAGFLDSIWPAKGDSPETIKIKKQQLNQLVSEKMNFPILRSYGINIGNVSQAARYGEAGEKKIQLGPPVRVK